MAAYSYVALNAKGKTTKGILHAADLKALRSILRDSGLDLVSYKETSEKSVTRGMFGAKLKPKEVTQFTRKLAALIGAGKDITEALESCEKQVKNRKSKAMILTIYSRLSEGGTLAKAFGAFPKTFSESFCATVEAGEESGTLAEALNRLADDRESQSKLKEQLLTAMAQPILLTITAIAVALFLTQSVLPSIIDSYSSANAELPSLTVAVLSTCNFVVANWPFLVLGLAAATAGSSLAMKQPQVRYFRDYLLIKTPGFGRVIAGFISLRYIELLDILQSSGMPLVNSMAVAERAITNRYASKQLKVARETMPENGKTICQGLSNTKLFPQMVLDFIETGEQAGRLSEMLQKSAEQQRGESKALIALSVKLISPILTLLVGGLILGIVLAIMEPIMNLSSLIK